MTTISDNSSFETTGLPHKRGSRDQSIGHRILLHDRAHPFVYELAGKSCGDQTYGRIRTVIVASLRPVPGFGFSLTGADPSKRNESDLVFASTARLSREPLMSGSTCTILAISSPGLPHRALISKPSIGTADCHTPRRRS